VPCALLPVQPFSISLPPHCCDPLPPHHPQESSPRRRFYWGYIWDGTGNRATAPIRDPGNKSHMPAAQYPLDAYPPFASGCGFALSRDLVHALLSQPLPDYRLLVSDVPRLGFAVVLGAV
jgi:hypothetical protein